MNKLALQTILRLVLTTITLFYAVVAAAVEGEKPMSMNLESSAFSHQSEIPVTYTCDGKDISPELKWSGVPKAAKSLVLIVDDPDAPDPSAPKMTWVHWVLYNIPTTVSAIRENISPKALPEGTKQGKNDWKRTGYGGPCPPIGRHRYFHKLYALDIVLPDMNQPDKARIEKAIEGHILESTELIGTYQRPK